MNKTLIYSIIVISSLLFIVLAVFAFLRIPGVTPLSQVPDNPVVVEVIHAAESLDLTSDAVVSARVWEKLREFTIKLEPQVTAIPWASASTPEVRVKAFHNGRELYLLMRWSDSTPEQEHREQQFSDACAVMFSLADTPEPQSIMMGFLQPVNIWHWKAVRDAEFWRGQTREVEAYSDYYYPYQQQEVDPITVERPASAVEELIARGVTSLEPRDHQRASGRGSWDNGEWKVVLTRPLYGVGDEDVNIAPGKNRWSAFAVWDGSRQERGSKKSISTWTILEFQPATELALK